MRKVAIISGFDSQFKWGGEVARRFYAKGWHVEFFCPLVRGGQISEGQLSSLKIPFRVTNCTEADVFDSLMLFDFDVIVFSVPGGMSEHGILRLKRVVDSCGESAPGRLKRRPILVSGFVGVNYENRMGAVVCRRLADIILANSELERQYFENVCSNLGFRQPLFLNGGLGLIDRDTCKKREQRSSGDSRFRILFAAQPTVPKTKPERVYLLWLLRDLAVARPDYDVVIKPRSRLDEQTFHREENHLAEVLAEFFDGDSLPPNLLFDYRPIQEQLIHTDLCLTISSTAALEAYAMGVPFAILADLGIKEPYGAEFFANSGCLVTAEQLARGAVPTPDPHWIEQNVAYGDDHFEGVLAATEELLHKQEQSGEMLPIETTDYDRARLPVVQFFEAWRSAPKKVVMVKDWRLQDKLETAEVVARYAAGPAPSPVSPRESGMEKQKEKKDRGDTGTRPFTSELSPWQRKARKFVTNPYAYFADSRTVRDSPFLGSLLRRLH